MHLDNSALTEGYDDPEDTQPTEDTPQGAPSVVDKVKLTQPADAANRRVQIPPRLVEEVQDNVELLRPVARSMAAVNLHNLFTRIQHPATSAKDRLDFQSMLNKMSGLDAKEQGNTGGAGFSITINIPQVGVDKGHIIEAKAAQVDESPALESDE